MASFTMASKPPLPDNDNLKPYQSMSHSIVHYSTEFVTF